MTLTVSDIDAVSCETCTIGTSEASVLRKV